MKITKSSFGKTRSGEEVELYTLKNNRDVTVKIITYGGIITELHVPDAQGKTADIVLGFNTINEYLAPHPFFGVLVGRYGNRIAGGQFALDGQTYTLAKNDGQNHLHGGITGFDKVVWDAEEIQTSDAVGLRLFYLSKDGEEGYPGNLKTTVKYLLNDENELTIHYEATTDKSTVVNLTQHTYFNLLGEGSGDVLEHEVWINADRFTAVNDALIPTGELRFVKNSPMDFTTQHSIGSTIKAVGGYDHNYVLNKDKNGLSLAARVVEPRSGRVMETWTTEPGVQFYTGNFLDGTFAGKWGQRYEKHAGFCLETQHYPDSPNHPEFPSTRLNPGETYRQTTIYKFMI